MTDICRDNGKSYFEEYKRKDGFIGYTESAKIKKNRDQFCNSIPNTKAIMEEITSKCRDPYFKDREYYELLYAEKYYCTTTDSKTGKHCDEVLDTPNENRYRILEPDYWKAPFDTPFRNWDPSLCHNSCIADLYPSILDLIKNLSYSSEFDIDSSEFNIYHKFFENYNDNPANCCGTDDGSIGADTACKADITFVKNLPEDFINNSKTIGSDSSTSGGSSLHRSSSYNPDRVSDDATIIGGILGGTFLLFWAFFAFLFIIFAVAHWKVFSKAGEKGWKAIVPLYNAYVLLRITWKTTYFWWLFVIGFVSGICFFIPFLGWLVDIAGAIAVFVIGVMANYYLSRSFGEEIGFTIGLVFLYPIFILILGFSSKKKYIGNGYEIHQKEKAFINNQVTNQNANAV